MAEVELVLDCRNTLGEGVWNGADRQSMVDRHR